MTDEESKTTTKYSVPDGHWEPDESDDHDGSDESPVSVDIHLDVCDEREEIEGYNGFRWTFVFNDEGMIHGVDKSHYCPGPGHTDPMGFRAWADVPEEVCEVVLERMNADEASEIVDIEATEEVAEEQWP